KHAAIVIGKIAAAVPIVVPITARVKGLSATSKIIKGIGRTIFTSKFRTKKMYLFSKIFPLRVTKKRTPIEIPIILEKINVKRTIKIVSPVASTTRSQNVLQSTLNAKYLPYFDNLLQFINNLLA